MISICRYLCYQGTPAALAQLLIAQQALTLSLNFAGADCCLAVEFWLCAISLSCKGWEISVSYGKGPGGQTKVAGAFVQVCVKTFHRERREDLLHPSVTCPSCVILPVCQKKKKKPKPRGIGPFSRSHWLAGSSTRQHDCSCCALCSC